MRNLHNPKSGCHYSLSFCDYSVFSKSHAVSFVCVITSPQAHKTLPYDIWLVIVNMQIFNSEEDTETNYFISASVIRVPKGAVEFPWIARQ